MSLDSYTSLITTLQGWLQKADVAADAPDCIALFEAWANRNFRVRQMEQEATAPAAEYMALPTDFLGLRDIQWQGSPRRQLAYMTPQQADDYDPFGTVGTPGYYTIVGNQIRLIRAPDSTTDVRIAYWARIPALSATNPTNWLLQEYPDAYLYGALVHGRARMADPGLAQFISSGFGKIVDEIQNSRSNVYGPLLQMRRA